MRWILSIAFFFICSYAYSQACEGGRGVNIFGDGDFGSGIANVVQTDPMIAPGYTYTTQVPPEDGFYVLTNGTQFWPSLYDAWLAIGDNSTDPSGYMMVVNASFDPGDFFNRTVTDLCPMTQYSFACDVINLYKPTASQNDIRPDVSFFLDGVNVLNTGQLEQNGQWTTYETTFTTSAFQTSVELVLRNNAPGGFGNDLAIDNIKFESCGPGISVTTDPPARLCVDAEELNLIATVDGSIPGFYQWQQSDDGGLSWTDLSGATDVNFTITQLSSGTFLYRVLFAQTASAITNPKCRVISEIVPVVIDPIEFEVRDTICMGNAVNFGGNTLSVGGNYRDTLIASTGCDSIVTLSLTVLPKLATQSEWIVKDPACQDSTTGSLELINIGPLYEPYTIHVNGDVQNVPLTLNNLEVGNYAVEVIDRYGCMYDTLLEINNTDFFDAYIPVRIEAELGEDLLINPVVTSNEYSVVWESDCLVQCDTCSPVRITPSGDCVITGKFTNTLGCTVSKTSIIDVSADRSIFIPQVFTPNGDGLNDHFFVQGNARTIESIDDLIVMDRWGNVVFTGPVRINDESSGWDGGLNSGLSINSGVYVYTLNVRYIDGTALRFSGDVLLMK